MIIACVEDDPVYAKFLEYTMGKDDENSVRMYKSGKEFITEIDADVDLLTLDYQLPDMTCEELIKKVQRKNPDLNVVVISAQEDVSTAVELLKEDGVYDYIVKNEETRGRLNLALRHIRETRELRKEVKTLRKEIQHKFNFKNLIGHSAPMRSIYGLLEKAALTNITVSLSGETGTGKELAARAIHFNSKVKSGPFIPVNLSAIPPSLIESELFGYEKGAFTGADSRRLGKFEEANGGTIFLDEIAELDTNLQSKILRVLQEKEIIRLGGSESIKVDFRLIIATHKNLAAAVNQGSFREDLYYRLLGLPIEMPALNTRGADIILLADHFIKSFCQENSLGMKKLDSATREKLLDYSWPGNVRELKAVVELACVLSRGEAIEVGDIVFNPSRANGNLLMKEKTLKEYISEIVTHFLRKNDFNVVATAKKLDVGKSTLYRMIKAGDIKVDKNG